MKLLKTKDFISFYGKPIGKQTEFWKQQFFSSKGGDGIFGCGDVYTQAPVDDVMTTSCPSLHEYPSEGLKILPNILNPSPSIRERVHPQ